jgi:hypothetical protein
MLYLSTILGEEFAEDASDNTYEEFIALKALKWAEEKDASGNPELSFEEFILSPYIDAALAL